MDPPRRRIALVIAPLALLLVAIVLLLPPRNPSLRRAGRPVQDLAGREVPVPERVQRVLALGPGSLRLVAYLDALDLVVGIEHIEKRMENDLYTRPYSSLLGEELLDLPVVGTGGAGALPDLEKVLMCRPDLVVAVGLDPVQLDNLQAKTGVPAIYLSYGELGVWREEAHLSLTLLGKLLGREDRAARLNAYIRSLEKDLRGRVADLRDSERPSAYFGGLSYKGAHGLDSTEGGYPPALMAGAHNLADDLGKKGHFFVDKEQILVWNPDTIFIDAGCRPVLDRDFEENREFYRLLEATRTGRVLSLLAYNAYNTNIELALLNAYFIGKSLYPERYRDIDMKEKTNEIMETFLGIRPDHVPPAYRPLGFPEKGPLEWR